jgi:two-component system, chemotaxis family, CheB/CheR fusion protein
VTDSERDNDPGRPGSEQRNGKPVIVAIGASAGGVRALQSFFSALPERTGAAFVVVVHLDPGHHSEMPAIIAARTSMRVVQVGTRDRLEADHVYVIPPDRRLRLTDHEISALEFDEPRGQRSPIDLFLRSLAERLGDGVAVILSGAGSDGAIGVRVVKEAGGIILVQDPGEAEYSSMPRSAIDTGVADFVLPARDLATRVADLIRVKENLPPDIRNFDEDLLRRIISHLHVRTGHDFSKYKRSTVLRRIARRMQVSRAGDLNEYYNVMREDSDEAQALLGDLLISVTTFFRDTEAFEKLAKSVIPELFKGENVDETIRVWISGCATGEEAYSFAILLLEEASRHSARRPIQVFGSDLDARALASAREGSYPLAIDTDITEERLRRFFVREGDSYRIRQEVREIVLFAVHDLLKDPPFSHVDLISCRNVMIYLDRELQEQVCSTFHYALNPGGYLFLGSSESAENPPGLFRVIDRSARIFQSMAIPGDKPRLLPRLLGLGPARGREQVMHLTRTVSPTMALGEAVMHRRTLEQVAPPSMLVDEAHRVIHLSENAGRYLMPSGGPLSGDAVDLVRLELRFELRSALNRAFDQNLPTLSLPILVRFNGAPHRVHISVKPIAANADDPRSAIVMFIEGEAVDEALIAPDQRTSDETVRRLTQELELTQTRLRTVREESDAANEELRAANEELQSINEEYRSTSEELETSKEELQSINEELQTVNSELNIKLEAVSRAHSDLQNLVAATDIGTLFLDVGLRIKRFTERVTDLFSITQTDEGRSITDFANELEYQDLVKDARTVLADLTPLRREVRSRSGRWYDTRVRPYRTVDDKIDGVVITFVDITERRRVDEALEISEANLRRDRHLVELSRDPIFIWDFDDGIVFWNRGSEDLYGYSSEEALGKRKDQLLETEVPGSSFAELRAKLLSDGSYSGQVRHRTKDGRELIVETRIVLDMVGGRRLALESTRDVTERMQWERRQQILLGELAHRVRNTLAVVQAIAHQSLRSGGTSEEFVERFDGRLAALASAHTLLVNSDWQGADFASLARSQLEVYISDSAPRVQLSGDPVMLSADLATPFGLVLHELATNAAKHGSLSRREGTVNLTWSVNSRNHPHTLKVVWQEQGGPRVTEPRAVGFGSTLIDHVIPGATVVREFRPAGLICTIDLPLRDPGEDGGAEAK